MNTTSVPIDTIVESCSMSNSSARMPAVHIVTIVALMGVPVLPFTRACTQLGGTKVVCITFSEIVSHVEQARESG